MGDRPATVRVARLRRVGEATAIGAAALAAFVWYRSVSQVRISSGSGFLGAAGLACCAVLLCAALLLRYRRPDSIVASTLALLSIGLTVGSWAVGPDVVLMAAIGPAVIADQTTVVLTLVIVAQAAVQLFSPFATAQQRERIEWLCLTGLVVGAIVLTGSLLGAKDLQALTNLDGLTGVFVVIGLVNFAELTRALGGGSLGILLADGIAGEEARRSLMILVPGVGMVFALATLGTWAGWYDARVAQVLTLSGAIGLGLGAASRSLTRLASAERIVRAAVEESRHIEDQFRAALEAAPSGMLLIGTSGRVVLVNGRAEVLFGYPSGGLIGVTLEDLVPERHRGSIVEVRRLCLAEPDARPIGQGPYLEARRQDDSEFPAEITLNPVVTPDGISVLVSVLDATLRQQAETSIAELNTALKAKEERFSLAVQGSNDGIWDWSPSGDLWLSGRAREMLGLGSQEVSVRQVAAIVHPDDRGAVVDAFLTHMTREDRLDIEGRIVEPSGQVRWFRVRAEGSRSYGKLVRSAGSIAETTALRSNIEALEESQRRFRVALDNHGVGFWEWNLRDDLLAWDENWLSAHGRVDSEPPSQATWIGLIHPDDRTRVQDALRSGLRAADPLIQVEYRARSAEGTLVWVCCRGRVAERDSAGRVVRMLGTVAAITDWKRVEGLLEQRNRELQSLLHVTSHDLREPLRAILGFSKIVAAKHHDVLDPSARDYLERVVKAATRLEQLINDIWTLSRARRIERPATRIDIESLVREAVNRLDERTRETGATVTILDGLPMAPVDRIWVVQAAYNLVLNALKFTTPGNAPEVEIGPWPPEGPPTGMVVRDRGFGVAPEHAERIFRLFQRAVGREIEGTGAGLAIVREVAERHGGKAWVQGRAGGGSEFVLTFADAAEASHQCIA